MKIIIEVEDDQTFGSTWDAYKKCIKIEEEFIKSIKFER